MKVITIDAPQSRRQIPREAGARPKAARQLPAKIERCCPRCRHHAYQWLTHRDNPAAIKNTKFHTATCVRCGHGWPCRVMERDR